MQVESIVYARLGPCCDAPRLWTNYGHWPLSATHVHGVCQSCGAIVTVNTATNLTMVLTGDGILGLRRYLPEQYRELTIEQEAIRMTAATVYLPPWTLAKFRLAVGQGLRARLQEELRAERGESRAPLKQAAVNRGIFPRFSALISRLLHRLTTLMTGVGSAATVAEEAPEPRTTDARAAARRTAV